MNKLTDREILFLAYGAIRASLTPHDDGLKAVLELIGDHLYPPEAPTNALVVEERPQPWKCGCGAHNEWEFDKCWKCRKAKSDHSIADAK